MLRSRPFLRFLELDLQNAKGEVVSFCVQIVEGASGQACGALIEEKYVALASCVRAGRGRFSTSALGLEKNTCWDERALSRLSASVEHGLMSFTHIFSCVLVCHSFRCDQFETRMAYVAQRAGSCVFPVLFLRRSHFRRMP